MNLFGDDALEDRLELIREMLGDWKKSELQLRLEAEGWELISNFSIAINTDEESSSLADLKEVYGGRYGRIRFEQAYNSCAIPMDGQRWVAIYTKPLLLTEICGV